MSRSLTFKFRINDEERKLLALIASQLKRSQGDTIRVLLYQSAYSKGILPIFEDPEIGFEHPHALQDHVQLVRHNNNV